MRAQHHTKLHACLGPVSTMTIGGSYDWQVHFIDKETEARGVAQVHIAGKELTGEPRLT